MNEKRNRLFSVPLMKQTIKDNWILTLVILLVMILMSSVINYAMCIMDDSENVISEKTEETQEDFYKYLYAMASFNEASGTELSYEDFNQSDNKTIYENAFRMMSTQTGEDFSVRNLENIVKSLKSDGVSMKKCVKQFEYVYVFQKEKGCFTGDELSMDEMIQLVLENAGVSYDLVENLEDMDMTSMINRMYFTVTGLLPILIYIVIVANGLIVNMVDRGSMAYILSTPIKRSSITFTQAIYLIFSPLFILAIVCGSRLLSNQVLYGDTKLTATVLLYIGMYLLVEAIAGICYFGSCLFNYSRKAVAFNGGITVWFFLASLLGMFGTNDLVNMGVGVQELSIFNKLTLIGLYDINSIGTIGTSNVDITCIWKLGVLFLIALVTYMAGGIIFKKKDLPL